MKNTISTFLFIFGCWSFSFSQQMAQYTQWSSHQFALNPAHAGIKRCLDLQLLFRTQWIGMDGAPQSGFATASVPLRSKRKKFLSGRHGMGVKFENDRLGQISMNRFNLAYAGHFNFTRETRLSLGVYAGILQFGFDPSKATTISPDLAVLKDASNVTPDAHFGAWYNGLNYYFGLTLNQLIPSKWPMGNTARQKFHMMLNAGYRWPINENLTFLPGALIKFPFAGPMVFDVNLNFDVQNMYSVGIGFRRQDALLFTAGLKIKEQFSIQYSFDYTISSLQRVSNNTHELSIGYITCKPENKGTSKCALFE